MQHHHLIACWADIPLVTVLQQLGFGSFGDDASSEENNTYQAIMQVRLSCLTQQQDTVHDRQSNNHSILRAVAKSNAHGMHAQ